MRMILTEWKRKAPGKRSYEYFQELGKKAWKRRREKVMIFELDMEVDNRGSLSSCIATWRGDGEEE